MSKLMRMERKITAEGRRIGIVGTGFIGTGLAWVLHKQTDIKLTKILTRRNPNEMSAFPFGGFVTNSIDELIENSDLIVECSGDTLHATDVIDRVMKASIPVVTMNSELHVTAGTYFARRGFITEAEGDQPGCLAALCETISSIGFSPLVFGNIKGFMKLNPTREEMEYWSKRNGISLEMTTSFTDGTKVQIEQALVANGLGAGIAVDGLLGLREDNGSLDEVSKKLGEISKKVGKPIADYVLAPKAPPGVFITAVHKKEHHAALKYYKMGDGPYYTLLQPYHLCHLEILKTIRRVFNGNGILLNNGLSPTISVAAIAKRTLKPGEKIIQGIGSFAVRGIAVSIKDNQNHVPIGLIRDAVITKRIEEGQLLTFDTIEIPETLALTAWKSI